MPDNHNTITPDMMVLDIVSMYNKTEPVFKNYDTDAGECICCHALFLPLEKVAEKYGLDLQDLLADLKSAIDT